MYTKIRLFFLLAFVTLAGQLKAQQVEYHYFDQKDSIRIEYRWARANLLDRNSDAVLYLQMTNQNDFQVKIVYDIGFYRDNELFLESTGNTLCLKPGQRRRGSRTDMRFSADGIQLSMVEEAWFDWDIIAFSVEASECDEKKP